MNFPFMGSRALSCINKHHHSECLPSASFLTNPLCPPQALCADHDVLQYEMSLWSAGISCPSCVSSQLLVCPQPTHWQVSMRSIRDIDL